MARSVVQYDKDLPEIEGRNPYEKPDAYLEKKSEEEWIVINKRRPSKMLLVNKLREEVDKWREQGYPGASHVTKRLFQYWFEEDHISENEPFKFYFGQREAVETLVYIVEILKNKDIIPLIKQFAQVTQLKLETDTGLIFQTTMDGKRQLRRYFSEINVDGIQDLPPENLRRYAIKMATGSGKTVVMAMIIVWSYFHKKMIPNSELTTNFLILAPNVIVYQRLEKDFAGNKIFHELPLVPPEWTFNLKVVLRGEDTELDPSSNLVLTNIQQIYESREKEWTPKNAVDALLGRPVSGNVTKYLSMFEKLKRLPDLMVLNDEAHHVHDDELAWNKTLLSLHQALPKGLSLWMDFSATPKDQNGTYYSWIICDYPLAQAVEDRIVKAPLIVHELNKKDPDKVTKDTVIEAYGEWIEAALGRWREHYKLYEKLGQKPVLFIMCEKSAFADAIGNWLTETPQFRLKKDEVLIIHTDSTGEITKGDLEKARQAARDIDDPKNKVKVIVSVLMLREGWDVKNVSVVLGLRPFTAKAKILPEQAIGRGLRLIKGISPDKTQTLEVIGTDGFEAIVRELEQEGVGLKTVTKAPTPPIWVEPIQEKIEYDIEIPLTKPIYFKNYKKFDELDISKLGAIYDQSELDRDIRTKLEMLFATTQTKVHEEQAIYGPIPTSNEILTSITNKVMREVKLSGVFSQIYPIVKQYISEKCFGTPINIDDENIRSHLKSQMLQTGIAKYLAKHIATLITEKKQIEFEDEEFRLSMTKPFTWRRKHVKCLKTIFNYTATYNDYESEFAYFLDHCPDIIKFAALAEHYTRFRVDYLSSNGALKFYYPDFIAVQKKQKETINWIIETKGRYFENLEYKDAAIKLWCDQISKAKKQNWKYIRVDQRTVPIKRFKDLTSFENLVKYIEQS